MSINNKISWADMESDDIPVETTFETRSDNQTETNSERKDYDGINQISVCTHWHPIETTRSYLERMYVQRRPMKSVFRNNTCFLVDSLTEFHKKTPCTLWHTR